MIIIKGVVSPFLPVAYHVSCVEFACNERWLHQMSFRVSVLVGATRRVRLRFELTPVLGKTTAARQGSLRSERVVGFVPRARLLRLRFRRPCGLLSMLRLAVTRVVGYDEHRCMR